MRFINPLKTGRYGTECEFPGRGGMSEGMSVEDIALKHNVSIEFIEQQIAKGLKVEREHTIDPAIAHIIAMDHLAEIPDYYDRLDRMEEEYKQEVAQSGQLVEFSTSEDTGGRLEEISFVKNTGKRKPKIDRRPKLLSRPKPRSRPRRNPEPESFSIERGYIEHIDLVNGSITLGVRHDYRLAVLDMMEFEPADIHPDTERTTGRWFLITRLRVPESMRQRGIGAFLYNKATEIADHYGLGMETHVAPIDPQQYPLLIRMLEKAGFEQGEMEGVMIRYPR